MEPVNSSSQKGFTLVEFLIAMVIVSVALLGLLQSVNYSIEHNMVTKLRDDAVRLADERMAVMKSNSFDAIEPVVKSELVELNVWNTKKKYSIGTTVTANSANLKNIEIDITWSYKGKNYSHAITSLVARQ
jgi:type IV pilus assembly protein PilV